MNILWPDFSCSRFRCLQPKSSYFFYQSTLYPSLSQKKLQARLNTYKTCCHVNWVCAATDVWTYTGGITTTFWDSMILVYSTAVTTCSYVSQRRIVFKPWLTVNTGGEGLGWDLQIIGHRIIREVFYETDRVWEKTLSTYNFALGSVLTCSIGCWID